MKLFPSTHSDLLHRLRKVIRNLSLRTTRDSQQVWYDFDRRYRQALLRFGRRRGLPPEDCQVLADEVFMVVCRKLLEFDPTRAHFHRWLLGIASKVTAELKRQRRRNGARERPLPSSSHYATSETSLPNPRDALIAREQFQVLCTAILDLRSQVSERDFRLVTSVLIDERNISAVAPELDMSAPAARKALQRALGKLKTIMRRYGLDQP